MRKKREPPRLVLDANVLISGLLWTGTPNAIMDAADTGRAVLVASPSIIDEVRAVLGGRSSLRALQRTAARSMS